MRAALRALDREEAALGTWLRQRVEESLADPRPDIPAEEVFARLRRQRPGWGSAGRDEDV